jgi:hypothetical protein
MDVHITTTRGAATHTIDLEAEPTASRQSVACGGASTTGRRSRRTPIEVVSRDGLRELVAFNPAHVIDVSVP